MTYPRLFRRQGELPRTGRPPVQWLQYTTVEASGRVVLVEMNQAALGWNFGRMQIQGGADWLTKNPESIVAMMLRDWDPITEIDDPELAAKILARVPA